MRQLVRSFTGDDAFDLLKAREYIVKYRKAASSYQLPQKLLVSREVEVFSVVGEKNKNHRSNFNQVSNSLFGNGLGENLLIPFVRMQHENERLLILPRDVGGFDGAS